MTHPFAYGERELEYLSSAEPKLGAYIAQLEAEGFRPSRPVEEDAFACLIRAINDQLISLKAAATIWGRITERYGDPVTPEALAAATPEEIHACGTTLKKAEYMHDIACMVQSGTLDLEGLRSTDDATVIETLVSLRGIGLWTAEMLLIHCYERPDVISFGDAAIRRGLCMLHDLDPKELTREQFDELTAAYHPFATTASIYLWYLSKQ